MRENADACRTSACARADVRGSRCTHATCRCTSSAAVLSRSALCRRGAGANADSARYGITYYDASHQKMLQDHHCGHDEGAAGSGRETVVRRRNHLSVRSSMTECDYYRLLEGDSALEGVPLGPYLPDYAEGHRKPLRRWSVRAEFGRMRATVDGSRGILWYRMRRRTTAIGEDGPMLKVRRARADEFDQVLDFYTNMIDGMRGTEFDVCWEHDVHPSSAFLRASVDAGEVYGAG